VHKHPLPRSAFASSGITPITVARIGQCSRVTLPAPNSDLGLSELFNRVFRVRRVVADKTDRNVTLKRVCRPLYTQRGGADGRYLLFPAACEPLVVQLLDVLNLPYTLTGRWPTALALPAKSARLVDMKLLDAVATHEHVVVRHEHHAVDVAHLIGQVCLAFPTLKIIVLVKQVAEATRVARRLLDIGVETSLFTSATRTKQKYSRVAVATFQSAGHEDAAIWSRDLLLIHDVADAMCESARVALRFAHHDHVSAPRVVAFASTDFRPSINQAAELLNVYGPVEVLVPAHGAVVRQVEYLCLPVAGMNYTKGDGVGCSSVGEAKRTLIWANPIRNRLIARVARGFAEGRVESVSKRFPELAGHPLLGKPVGVLVVVENGVHAANLLHRHLRGWSTVGPAIGRVPPAAPRWGWPADKPLPAVATFDGLNRFNIAAYDLIVRADGGTGALPLSKTALVSGNSTLPPLLLLDIDDWRDPVLASHAEQRRGAYDALGWLPVDGSREHRELHRFLDRHPQGNKLRSQIEQMAKRIAIENRAG